MHRRREANWIGFQEAQKTISSLKQEVEIAEKKLLNVKRSFNKGFRAHVLPTEPVQALELTKPPVSKVPSYFIKESFPLRHKVLHTSEEKLTVPKEIYSTSEEEPNLQPIKFLQTELLDFQSPLIKSSFDDLSKLSSSEDSLLSSEVKPSSEGTSSLIASVYGDAKKQHKRHKSSVTEVSSDIPKSASSLTSNRDEVSKQAKSNSEERKQYVVTENIGMEWEEVSHNKAFFIQNRFKAGNFNKLKDIIEKQKRKQELYELQLEKEISHHPEQSYVKSFHVNGIQSLELFEDNEAPLAPKRKVRTVQSVPTYKGFSVPPKNLPTGTRWRKQKNKYTLAKSSNTKNGGANTPKRIKAVVKSRSDFVSASHWRNAEKGNENDDKESFKKAADSEHFEVSEEISKNKSENTENDSNLNSNVKPVEENINAKIDIQSILEEGRLSDNDEDSDNSLKDVNDETFSHDVKMQSQISRTDNDQHSLKENEKPVKPRGVKRKSKKPPEQKMSSPKIRHYDVDKVRDYIKKKKEERKKRHLDEHKKRLHDAQKKKESLKKLLEYQKQNNKAVTKSKPSSPIKTFHKKDSIVREQDREEKGFALKNAFPSEDSVAEKVNTEGKDLPASSHDISKGISTEGSQRKETSVETQINRSKSQRKRESVHIDISIPKCTVPETPLPTPPTKQFKKSSNPAWVSSSEGIQATENERSMGKINPKDTTSSLKASTSDEIKRKVVRDEKIDDIENSYSNNIPDIFNSLSSISTPSTISHIPGVPLKLIEEMKIPREPIPELKPKKDYVLKDLIKSINMMTQPLEPFLRTKRWLDENPLPPKPAKSRLTEITNFTKQKQAHLPEKETDVHLSTPKPGNSKHTSFKEQVSGIGDVSQLYAKILGKESSAKKPKASYREQHFAKKDYKSKTPQQHATEDEIIEGSLGSEVEYILDGTQRNVDDNQHSEASISSSHFSDFQKINQIPDSFNLINTWKRKPLSLTIQDGKTKGILHPARLTENNVPYEEIYQSLINSEQTDSESKPTESNLTEISQGTLLSQEVEYSSYTSIQQSVEHSVSKQNGSSEIVSKLSRVITVSNHSGVGSSTSNSSKSSVISQLSVSSKHSVSGKVSQSVTTEKDSNLIKVSDRGSISYKQTEKNSAPDDIASENSHETVPSAISNNVSDGILTGSIQSEDNLEDVQENISDAHSTGISQMILSGTINSGYSLDIGGEKSGKEKTGISQMVLSGTIDSEYTLDIDEEKSSKEKTDESGKDIEEAIPGKASASGSSISEVISVVENSKGFKSSPESLQSNKTTEPSRHDVASAHSSGDKSEKISSSSISEENTLQESKSSTVTDQKSSSSHSSKASQAKVENSTLLLKKDQLQKIPDVQTGSQNSVTIDFRQPLRLTLSNGEPMQSNQGMDLHDNQYLHTQVVTRVASEAAAAAATSAVIAVFETQKALLAEKNYLGLINSYGRSSSSKKTQYSSDFESSQAIKSSSHSPLSSVNGSKQSESVPEDMRVSSNNELSSRNGSAIGSSPTQHSLHHEDRIVPLKSSNSSVVKTEDNISFPSEEIEDESERTTKRSKRKISGNMSSPSPASLSDNESISSDTLMSSHSNFSQLNDSAASDDSFAQLTLDVVRSMTHEEEVRAKHQLSWLQFQEKNLVQKARTDMMWLELLKRKFREKGAKRKVSAIKKKQKELVLQLRQERAQLQSMQEAYKSISQKHCSLLEDKKKLLKEPNSLAYQLLSKDEKSHTSKYPEGKLTKGKSSSSTPTVASDNDIKTVVDEESVSEVPEMLKGLASNSSQESVVETQASDVVKTSNSSQNKSQRSSPNAVFSPLNAVQSNSNTSLHSNPLETALQGKKLEASKRHLTKREQRILQRRKQAENLLQWQMKLDSEEMAVRELEQKALDLVDHSKKRTKYYVSSSGSANADEKRKESMYGSLPTSNETQSKLSGNTPELLVSETDDKITKLDESISTNISERGSDGSKNENSRASSDTHSNSIVSEEIRSGSVESFIQTAESAENGSQAEVPEDVSYQVSPSIKDKSSSSDIYSESFESSISRKSLSARNSSSPIKNSSPSRSIKRTSGPGIRLPLVPRNLRRHDSSGSDDSYTISQSETASDQSDIEVRIHALAEELKRRKAEAEKLKKEQRKKYREQLKEKELSLQKQLEAYNQYIQQAKLELEHQIESSVSPPQTSDVVKPRIKWPRPEQVIDSRRVRKQAALIADNFALEKKSEIVNSSPEYVESSEPSVSKEKENVKKYTPESTLKTDDGSISKEISEKSVADSKEVSEMLSASNSSEIQDISEVQQSKSPSSEVSSDIKGTSEANESFSNLSVTSQKVDEVKSSDSEQKSSPVASFIEENKSSIDTVEYKSQTDTFVTESGSSKSYDSYSSQQNDDSISTASNKLVSSDDELSAKMSKDISEDTVQKSEVPHSHDISHESSSLESSVSEIQSVVNSASLEEDINSESSSKKCSNSDGCDPALDKEMASESKHKDSDIKSEKTELCVLPDVQKSSVAAVENKAKISPSESEIVNIVNYISSSCIDDGIKCMLRISNDKGLFRNLSISSAHRKKAPDCSLNMKEKMAETITETLYDSFFKDSFALFYSILKRLKSETRNSENSSDPELDSQNAPNVAQIDAPVNSSMTTGENSSEFPLSYLTQDINENQIFVKSAESDTDDGVVSKRDQQIQQLEQQLIQQYSYFYRKIPNKPPPPYTPPSSSALSFEFPFVKEKPVQKVTTVKEVNKHIDQIMDNAVEILLDGRQKGLALTDVALPTENPISQQLELTLPHQSVFIGFLFDLTKEVVLEQFSETMQKPKPWLRPRKLTPKPLIPSSKKTVTGVIEKQVKKALKINEDPPTINQRNKALWSSLKLGRKKRDFVDTILISELKEEEPDWVNYDQDEITVKLQIADSIFNVLINDTVNVIKDLQHKINS